MDRAQLPLSLIEATLGAVLVFSVALGFALGVPAADTRTPQLDAYADDATTVLSNESPRHGGTTRLAELVASEDGFERERAAVARRVDRILPANVMYRLVTPHGTVGYPRPAGVATGVATVPTGYGRVRIEVWYA